jgi:SAM-dependent methyltransferase
MERNKEAGICCLTVTPFPKKEKVLPDGTRLLLTESPTLDWHEHYCAMVTPVNWNFVVAHPRGMLVDEARNWAVEKAREVRAKYLFFIDYDVLVPPDALLRLQYDMEQHPEADVFCGVYCSKCNVPQPLIFKRDGFGAWWDWKVGEIHELTPDGGCHMGLTLLRVSAFDKIDAHFAARNEPRPPYFLTDRRVSDGGMFIGTEDLAFCKLLREAGGRIFADTQVLAGHQCLQTHKVYGLPLTSKPVTKSWIRLAQEGKSVALDLGCGETRHEFPGYDVTLRCDARPEVEPDYLVDVRHLPFPDGFAAHVFSSHCLEHFGRWEAADVLKEWARVLKPGGTMRLIVPDVTWAARRILEKGYADGDAMNVLYGAQEAHGYARELNSHHVGFTPLSLQALAEECGLEVISLEHGDTNPSLGYNIVLDARKPAPADAKASLESSPNGAEKVERLSGEVAGLSRELQLLRGGEGA